MDDQAFLLWVYVRLAKIHNEAEDLDYMGQLRAIIANTSPDQNTPNDGRGGRNIEELMKVTNTVTPTF